MLTNLASYIWHISLLISCLHLMDGVNAGGVYCLGGDQLAGVIFGSIVGTVAALAALFLTVIYLKRKQAKGGLLKDVPLDALSEGANTEPNSHGGTLISNATHDRCQLCGCSQNDQSSPPPIHYTPTPTLGNTEKNQLANIQQTNGSVALRQLNTVGQTSSEYRTKKKRTNAFISWWTRRDSLKRPISYSVESLSSVDEIVRVGLKSRDAGGLGFNICGNLRDGIYIKSLSNRGPAKETGSIEEGDRILSLAVNMENIVFEDALTLISYASAYPVTLELQRSQGSTPAAVVESFSYSDKVSSPSARSLYHPLFKSQSIDDVRAFHPFDVDAADTMGNEPAGVSRSPWEDPDEITSDQPVPTPRCTLQLIQETPQLPRRSPLIPRHLTDDASSVSSSVSSDINLGSNHGRTERMNSTTITVTAEINSLVCQEDTANGILHEQDPYAGLSYEDRMQIIRLSYDDIDSASHPAVSPSPPVGVRMLSAGDVVRHRTQRDTVDPTGKRDDGTTSAEDDALSMGDSPSSLDSSTNDTNQNIFPVNSHSCDHRIDSFTSPSGSSIGASSESDHHNSPDLSKRDNGYHVPVNGNGSTTDDELDKEQYEKLLYFQRQLAKQHEELARLGIHLPVHTGSSEHKFDQQYSA